MENLIRGTRVPGGWVGTVLPMAFRLTAEEYKESDGVRRAVSGVE